ncbi:MAG TPA: MnhB domain-containing protein, partial [Ottowia sp.]|nr:MnhB domain-containing protein [Ottowia sp.]
LAIWHGFNKPLVMSLIALAGGVALFLWGRRRLTASRAGAMALPAWLDGQLLFQRLLLGLDRASRGALRRLSTTRLQPQILVIVLAAIVLGAAALWPTGISWGERARVPGNAAFALLWVLGGLAALGTAHQAKYHRLAALVMLGTVGLVVSLSFLWLSAPDLALTQLTVEAVTTILFLLGLRWLPKRMPQPRQRLHPRVRARRLRDLLVAIAAGSGMAALAYAMLTRPAPQSIAPFFIDRALPEGGGTNVVNVMLVDFRAFDTLGEITVLGIVALTVYALLRRFRPPREMATLPPQQRAIVSDLVTDLINPRTAPDTALGYMLVPAVLVRLLLPVAAVIAMHLLMRGHNLPGGGFVAGLVVAIAFVAQYVVAGTLWVEAHLQLKVIRWIAAGLLLAALTGLGSLLLGYPLLTTHTAHPWLPLLGQVHVPSAVFFDLGVFAVVVGATLLILTALAHQSVRGHRQSGDSAGSDATALPEAG